MKLNYTDTESSPVSVTLTLRELNWLRTSILDNTKSTERTRQTMHDKLNEVYKDALKQATRDIKHYADVDQTNQGD
jgi:hypothetical protein